MNKKKLCKNKAKIGTSHLRNSSASTSWSCISSARFSKANRLAHLLSRCVQAAHLWLTRRSTTWPQSWSHCLWLLSLWAYRILSCPSCILIPPDWQSCQLWQLKGLYGILLLWTSCHCIPRSKVHWLYLCTRSLCLILLISLRYIASTYRAVRVDTTRASRILIVGAVMTRLVMLNHIKIKWTHWDWPELLVLILRPSIVHDVLANCESGRGWVCCTRCYVRIRGNS